MREIWLNPKYSFHYIQDKIIENIGVSINLSFLLVFLVMIHPTLILLFISIVFALLMGLIHFEGH